MKKEIGPKYAYPNTKSYRKILNKKERARCNEKILLSENPCSEADSWDNDFPDSRENGGEALKEWPKSLSRDGYADKF